MSRHAVRVDLVIEVDDPTTFQTKMLADPAIYQGPLDVGGLTSIDNGVARAVHDAVATRVAAQLDLLGLRVTFSNTTAADLPEGT